MRDVIYDQAFDSEMVVWILAQVSNGTPCIYVIKNPRKHPLMNTCRQLRQELIGRDLNVYARKHIHAHGQDMDLLSARGIPTPHRMRLETLVSIDEKLSCEKQYLSQLWSNVSSFNEIAGRLKSLHIDLRAYEASHFGLNPDPAAALKRYLEELTKNHATLESVSFTFERQTTQVQMIKD
jgi:hypothetical protein